MNDTSDVIRWGSEVKLRVCTCGCCWSPCARMHQLHAVASARLDAVATGTKRMCDGASDLLRGFSQATHGENCVTSVRQASHSQSTKSGYEFLCPATKAWTVLYLSSFIFRLWRPFCILDIGDEAAGWRSWPRHSSVEIVNMCRVIPILHGHPF